VIQLFFRGESVGESLSSLGASSLENVSAISRLHSLAEAVLNLSLALFGLISSEHLRLPPLVSVRWKQAAHVKNSALTVLYCYSPWDKPTFTQ
jgi:hypothetical protein